MKRLTPEQITSIIHRVCYEGEPMKAVALDIGVHKRTVEKLVIRYEERSHELRKAG